MEESRIERIVQEKIMERIVEDEKQVLEEIDNSVKSIIYLAAKEEKIGAMLEDIEKCLRIRKTKMGDISRIQKII